jgi:hypothetical protein
MVYIWVIGTGRMMIINDDVPEPDMIYFYIWIDCKGVPGSECRTGPRLVGCRLGLEKNN